ncbi:MAG: AAA family ATPase [Ardenticatenaceae bacterium]
MKFPYGISDFHKIITQDYFYVDRTSHIREIEEYGQSLLFLRPRRFGKSLLLSTLENYYDVNKADQFERLFGHLVIGQNPTPKHNQYLVMRWDFSEVKTIGSIEQITKSLYNQLNKQIRDFAVRYQEILDEEVEIDREDALFSFGTALTAVQQSPYRMYLLIDEYDNFANKVLMGGQVASRQRYEELVKGEGLLKTVLSSVKSATSGFGLDRIFLTGVSPIVMSDITSGHNISEDISLEPDFNGLCGFWESDIESALQQVVRSCGLQPEVSVFALQMMRLFYDGYCFTYYHDCANKELVYNSTLALYFLKHYQRHCHPPLNMLDDNLAMDHSKLIYISRRANGERLIQDALQEEKPITIQRLASRFGVADILATQQKTSFLASLLYYFGVLTLGGRNRRAKLILKIPNLVVRRLYVEHLAEVLLPVGEREASELVADIFCSTGDMKPLADFIEQRYFKIFDNRDYKGANELTLKTIFLTVLFNDTSYIMDSELALERTYTDFTMIVRPDMRQYQLLDILIELKFLKLSEAELKGLEVRKKSREEVLALKNVKKEMEAAVAQVKGYQTRLLAKYGTTLKLRTYAVVAVGFEKVVWQEVPPPKSALTHCLTELREDAIKTKE